MFRKEKSGRHSKSQNAAVKVKEGHHKKRRKFVSPIDGAERSVRLTSIQRVKCPEPLQSRQVKDSQCMIRKDPRLTLTKIKEVKKWTYAGYGSSSDTCYMSGSVTTRPDYYTVIPSLQCKLKGNATAKRHDQMAKSVKDNNRQGIGETRQGTGETTATVTARDENSSNAICPGSDETDNNFEDDEEGDDDDDEEEDEEDIGGMPQAVRAMTQSHIDAFRQNKDVVDIHKRRMESLARNISSTRLTRHLATEGYFNYDYSRHARVGCVSHTARLAKKKLVEKAGSISNGKKQTDCV